MEAVDAPGAVAATKEIEESDTLLFLSSAPVEAPVPLEAAAADCINSATEADILLTVRG